MERANSLFFECVEDAIREDVDALGGPKKAAQIFFPDKTVDQGAALIRAWSNSERAERPSPSQYIMLKAKAKEAGSFSCVRYEEHTLSCKVQWLDPEDEAEQIRRELRDQLRSINQRMERLERAEQRAALKAVR